MAEKHIRIISHTHWDREWYLNAKYVNEWLIDFFNSLFEMFEREPEYKFLLDGQMSIVEDLLEEVRKAGKDPQEYRNKISGYVSSGNLYIGPYYLQPDWQLISEEASVRNLLIGGAMAKSLGKIMRAGWLPDNFGQISQIPQIHKEFGMDGLFVWRGVNLRPDEVATEFEWEAPDGSKVLSVYLLCGYRNAMRLAETPDIMEGRIKSEVNRLIPFSNTDHMLLLNGYDQEIQADDILPFIKDGKMDTETFDIRQTSPDQYIKEIQSEIKTDLTVVKGQMYNGRYSSVFPGTLSSRVYTKQRNETSQRLVERYAERLSALTSVMGKEYPKETLDRAWKMIMKNHAHDTICGVSVDDVATDMMERCGQADGISQALLNNAAELLIGSVDTVNAYDARRVYAVVNTLFFDRDIVLTIPVKEENEAFLDASGNALEYVKDGESYQVFVKAVVEKDGTVTLTEKKSGKVYNKLLCFEDGGDMGDEYSYSYVEGEKLIYSTDFPAKITKECSSEVMQRVKIETVMNLPVGLTDSRKSRAKECKELPIVTFVTLKKDARYLEIRTEIKNTVKDHRIRVLFPTGICAEQSYSQTQFDISEHEIEPAPYGELPKKVVMTIRGAYEPMPATTFPQKSFCGVEADGDGMAILNYGLQEYEVLREERTIALTLLRGVGMITNADFPTRIGDAGPFILTPEAQCLRELSFEYAIYPYQGNRETAEVEKIADEFSTPVLLYETNSHFGVLPKQAELFSVKDDNNTVVVSAIKRSENNRGLVIRVYNISSAETEAHIKTKFRIFGAQQVTLEETFIRDLKYADHEVSIKVPSHKIVTMLLEIDEKPILSYNEYARANQVKMAPPGCDFSKYSSVEMISGDKVEAEKVRVQELEKKLDQAQRELREADTEDKAKYSFISMQEETIGREYLEAAISALLIEKKWIEQNGGNSAERIGRLDEIDRELRKCGMQLNLRRISKRKQEYIVDYYAELENAESGL